MSIDDITLAGHIAAFFDAAATPVDRHLVLDTAPEVLGVEGARLTRALVGTTSVRVLGGHDPRSLEVFGLETSLAPMSDITPAGSVLARCGEIGIEPALSERFGPYQAPV